ncbi:MAG: SpoIIE family protein phosphatase [Rhodopseudomonas sp.]|nr:SpoIIE family protein phosphatase [Rhodopseudomonas sp.]
MSSHVEFALAQGRGGRENQEDFCAVWADGKTVDAEKDNFYSGRVKGDLIAVLCDGMGGHNAGEVASKLATVTFLDALKSSHSAKAPGPTPSASLIDACQAANVAIAGKIDADGSLDGMGTTLVGVRLVQSKLSWVSVGDSALYLYRRGTITQLNADHSMRPVIAQMVATKIISADEAARHPDRNALRSALCGDRLSLIDGDGLPMNLQKGDVVLVASDGIETLPASTLRAFLKPRLFWSVAKAARRIVSACLKAGGKSQDNTTVILLRIR